MNRRQSTPRSLRDSSGSTVLEFALIMPVFLLFILGFFDFSYWMYVRSTAGGWPDAIDRSTAA